MTPKPLFSLDDAFAAGMPCGICGELAIKVVHIEKLPDYVACSSCGSAFVVEDDGHRIMYGKIPSNFPDTRKFALKEWLWPEAVNTLAESERQIQIQTSKPDTAPFTDEVDEQKEAITSQTLELELENNVDQILKGTAPFSIDIDKTPDFGKQPALEENPTAFPEIEESIEELPETEITEPPPMSELFPEPGLADQEDEKSEKKDALPEWLAAEISEPIDSQEASLDEPLDQELPSALPGILAQSESPPLEKKSEAPALPPVSSTRKHVGEPERGKRFRAKISGDQIKFPKNVCAHCLRTPVSLALTAYGSLPRRGKTGERKSLDFRLPLCRDCRQRASARSDSEKTSRMFAWLISAISALILTGSALVFNLVDLSENLLVGIVALVILAVLSFSIPALILFSRANRNPQPKDAVYVLTTLAISESENPEETIFDWRNQGYSELFRQVNRNHASGPVELIDDIAFAALLAESEDVDLFEDIDIPPTDPIFEANDPQEIRAEEGNFFEPDIDED
jgi:hypothetical protein